MNLKTTAKKSNRFIKSTLFNEIVIFDPGTIELQSFQMNIDPMYFGYLIWGIVVFVILAIVYLNILFWAHRKNNQQHVSNLEEMIRERDFVIYTNTSEQIESFKKAMQMHLSGISDRIKSNELNTNKLINQLDALLESLSDEDDEAGELNSNTGIETKPDE